MNGSSEITGNRTSVWPRKRRRIGLWGTLVACSVLFVAVVDKSVAMMQSPSAGRVIMVGAYAAGLAAACFALWQIIAHRQG